ncbi:alpha/beta hydrolase [Actinospica durhamensis]|uniref:Alpha/beta hydrolase n=1 Tax=Actinospica durhamensis TaxID=1508375 RepID=A0A941ISG9_9ACTN|nr:alpha/beta hydrolase [Actinospica durhamensis]MBR7834883.1 alpha/beta hydrolase [Actinospica durhamensis]
MTIDRRRALQLGLGAAAATAAAEVPSAAWAGESATADQTATASMTDAQLARTLGAGFQNGYATVNGVRLHYVAGGSGAPLFLLPGWPETWWEYRDVMPALAQNHRVIAVDLRGMGGSDKPAGGYDKKTMAGDIYGLVQALGYQKADIAGHDIGSQVAFSYAANYPQGANRIALLDVLHPDSSFYQLPLLAPPTGGFAPWWFAFNQLTVLPEQLLAGRAQYMIDWMFDTFLVNQAAIGSTDRAVYAAAYNQPGAIAGSTGWYQAFGQDIVDLAGYGTIEMPVLGLVSSLFYPQMSAVLPTQASDATIVEVLDAGHYFIEEQPQFVIDQFNAFFV